MRRERRYGTWVAWGTLHYGIGSVAEIICAVMSATLGAPIVVLLLSGMLDGAIVMVTNVR